jgi:hypothetical protein
MRMWNGLNWLIQRLNFMKTKLNFRVSYKQGIY